jgi:hypothetical protein
LAFPAFVSVTNSGEATNRTSFSVSVPAVDAGDRLICTIIHGDGTDTGGAAPANWARLDSSYAGIAVYERIFGSSAGSGTVTFTQAVNNWWAAQVYRISGSHASTATSISTRASGTSANPNCPSLAPGTTEDWFWIADAVYGHALGTDRTTSSYPSGYTGTTDSDPGGGFGQVRVASGYKTANAASDDPGTFTITGSLAWIAVTLAVPPVAAPTGTIASTLAKALFTGTGSHGQAGSIASTLQAATASLTGAQEQSGTWSSTMQAATFTASGSQDGGVEGTLGATLTKATASLTGEQSQTGTWASELQKALFSGTAAQNMTGTWSSTLQPLTFSATGTNAQTGSIASELQEPTFAATGVMHPAGIMGAVLEELQFNGTATHAQSGEMAVSLQALTAAMTATQTQSGSIVATLQSALFNATGTQIYTGTLAATLQAATATFTGLFDIEGYIAWFSYSDLTDTGVIRFTYAEQTDVGEIRFSYSDQTDTGTIKFSFADVTDTGSITFRTEVV